MMDSRTNGEILDTWMEVKALVEGKRKKYNRSGQRTIFVAIRDHQTLNHQVKI